MARHHIPADEAGEHQAAATCPCRPVRRELSPADVDHTPMSADQRREVGQDAAAHE